MTTKKTNKTAISKAASAFGRLGGRAVVKKYGKAHMRKIGQKGADARWNK